MTQVHDEASFLAAVERDAVRLVRFVWCDPVAVIHAKSVHVGRLPGKAESGIGVARAQNALDLFEHLVDVEGLDPVGEVRLVPDVATYGTLPWVHRTGAVLVDMRDQALHDWDCCPRAFARGALAAAAAEGLLIRSSFENEFYLARRTESGLQPFGNGQCYSTAGLDRVADVMHDVTDALLARGLVVEQVINEYGNGQQEISVRYADGIAAADNQLVFRDTVRGVVEVGHGLVALFGPKPFAEQIGSGCHLHLSLWDPAGERNLTYDGSREGGLSLLGEHFLAGLLEHLPALVALTCPSFLSYERLAPHMWAGSLVAWGFDNREAPVRVASPFAGRVEESTNAELKASDGSANPHLALGAVVLAGLDGVRRGLRLPEPARRDPARLNPAEREACGVRPLPTTMLEALDCLEKDEVLMTGLGDLLGRCYLALRRSEYDTAMSMGADAVRAYTADIY